MYLLHLQDTQNASPLPSDFGHAAAVEGTLGAQGPLDGEAVFHVTHSSVQRVEYSDTLAFSQMLIKHMFMPFNHRRKEMIPSYDAPKNLESYFPVHFPLGRDGPETVGFVLGVWVKHALKVHNSRFAQDVDFIFLSMRFFGGRG